MDWHEVRQVGVESFCCSAPGRVDATHPKPVLQQVERGQAGCRWPRSASASKATKEWQAYQAKFDSAQDAVPEAAKDAYSIAMHSTPLSYQVRSSFCQEVPQTSGYASRVSIEGS